MAKAEKSSTSNAGSNPFITDVQAKTDKEIAAGYSNGTQAVEEAIAGLTVLREKLRTQAVETSEVAEARRRAHDKALYDLERDRQAVRDRYAAEDKERQESFEKRDQALADAETELLALLKVSVGADDAVPRVQVIREALAKRISEAEKLAATNATAAAQAAYATQKQLDDANAEKVNALLRQENDQLKVTNAALKAQNERLAAAQAQAVADMKEVAAGAFQAAGGVVHQGNRALSDAASAPGRNGR